jgi:toxin HigB-1
MIKSFGDKDTQALFSGRCPNKWKTFQNQAERKLIQLEVAASLDFLRVPPGNQLEKLKGDRTGQWSIRINDRWRICFRWENTDAWHVEIVDYH